MRCDLARDLIEHREVGSLGPAWTAELDEHVRRCPDCRLAAAREASLSQVLRDAATPCPAVDLAERVTRRIGALERPDRRLVRPEDLSSAVAAGIAAIAALAGSWTLWGGAILEGARIARTLGGSLFLVAFGLWTPVARVAAALTRTSAALLEALWSLARAVTSGVSAWQPFVAALGVAILLALTGLVLRDARRAASRGRER